MKTNSKYLVVPALMIIAAAWIESNEAVAQQLTSTSGSNSSGAKAYASLGKAEPARPDLVVGSETCVKCHASEIRVWQATPHAKTFSELHRKPEARTIATKLGLQSIKHSGRCVDCHYTQKAQSHGQAGVISGVSCESCHGAAKEWLDLHHDYGGPNLKRTDESPQHRRERITKSIAAGMRNPSNVYAVAQSCLRCHTTADEELVNVGGHPTGSLEFEFVTWSQGSIRHNFVQSDGKQNAVRSPEKLRVMFVAGMIAELEASLRATASATQKAKFGVTSASRAARTIKRLQSVAAKVDEPLIDEVLKVARSAPLKLNQREALNRVADRIAMLGFQFADTSDGASLAALDRYIPKGRK
ncbi:MAG: cytochrome c family protein [Planctomycetota bacterium]